MTAGIDALMNEVKALLRAKARCMTLTEDMIASIRPSGPVTPVHLPVLDLLPAMVETAAPETKPTVEALIAAAPDLGWRQTYSEDDGFDEHYLDTYGWCDLAGPTGPYQADGIRVMTGYWGKGLVYPNHSHPPEEHYLFLAGGAWVRLGDDPFRHLGAGSVFHTPPHAVHSAEMRDGALLAIAIWRGEDTSVRINLTETDRTVSR
jgi:mannose-6-phosphate isomerase-like protein (cupin superfamily)